MEVKATGIVTKNHNNGKKINVQWKIETKLKEWYYFTFIRVIWKVKSNPENWMCVALIDFTFYDKSQDICHFENEIYWKKNLNKKSGDKKITKRQNQKNIFEERFVQQVKL